MGDPKARLSYARQSWRWIFEAMIIVCQFEKKIKPLSIILGSFSVNQLSPLMVD